MSIRETLQNSKMATFCVQLPSALQNGMPTPNGTGFFISADGWFVTALHVIDEALKSENSDIRDPSKWWLMKEWGSGPGAMCQHITLGPILPDLDIAFLKVDFEANRQKAWLEGCTAFPHIKPSLRVLDDGEPVYSY